MNDVIIMSIIFMLIAIVPIAVCYIFRVKREKIDNQDIRKIIDESW